nr:transmembrane protein 186-like [Procambarus clarkii]
MFSTSLCQQFYQRRIPVVALSLCNTNVVRSLSAAPRRFQCRESRTTTASNPLQNGNNFQVIYKFPYIRVARALCRLKIYQTAVTSLAVPGTGYLAYVGVVQPGIFISATVINAFACVTLYVMGEIFRRIVGNIYYDGERRLVKVSHLTFWGRRSDVYIPPEDIIPLTDTSDNPTDIYTQLLRYSQPKFNLFLCLRFGGIIDEEKFSNVFGLLNPEEQMKTFNSSEK